MDRACLPRRLATVSFVSLLASACGVDDPKTPAQGEPPDDPVIGAPVVPVGPIDVDVPRSPPPPAEACIAPGVSAAQYGTAGIDSFRDVVVTRDGTILIAGVDRGQSSVEGVVSLSRGVVLTYRADTGFATRGVLDTAGTDSFESIAIDADTDRVWAAARTNDAMPGFPGAGGDDFVLGDVTLAHGFQALTRGFDSTPELPRQIAARGGRVAVAGSESRLVSGGATWTNPFLATYVASTTMAPQWFMSRRRAETEVFSVVDVSAEAIVVGGQIDDGEMPGMFIAAYSHDADLLWRHQLSTQAFDSIVAVKLLADGTVLWAGTTTAVLGDEAHGGSDVVVGRFDAATGTAMWVTQLGGAADERAADLAVSSDGQIYVAGDVASADVLDRDVLMLTLDAEGNATGMQQWASDGIDTPSAIALDACGTAVIVGTTTGDLGAPSAGMRDGFVLIAR